MEKTEIKKDTSKPKTAKTVSLEAPLYNQSGKEVKKISLPESVFGLSWNADLVHQVTVSMLSSARNLIAHTKTRGEVSGGGKKPWKQKGTGRARHGSTRSPIWVGGGVTHGPRNDKNYTKKVNKKMKAKALYTILSAKFKKGQILFVDGLNFSEPKTKEASKILSSLSSVTGFSDLLTKRKNSAYISLSSKNQATEKSFNNFGNVEVDEIRNINPVDILNYKYLIIENPEKGLSSISTKLSK